MPAVAAVHRVRALDARHDLPLHPELVREARRLGITAIPLVVEATDPRLGRQRGRARGPIDREHRGDPLVRRFGLARRRGRVDAEADDVTDADGDVRSPSTADATLFPLLRASGEGDGVHAPAATTHRTARQLTAVMLPVRDQRDMLRSCPLAYQYTPSPSAARSVVPSLASVSAAPPALLTRAIRADSDQ